jgi:hypothetical protein
MREGDERSARRILLANGVGVDRDIRRARGRSDEKREKYELSRRWASAGSTAVNPKAATETGVNRGPTRSMTPVERIETIAPIPTPTSATPRSASLAF